MASPDETEIGSLARRGIEALKCCCLDDPTGSNDGFLWREMSFNAALRMRLYQGDVPGKVTRHKAVVLVPHSPREFLDALLNDPRRLVWDASISHLESVAVGESGRLWIQYGVTKGVFGVSARDFVSAVGFEDLDGGGIVHGGSGIPAGHPSFPERPGIVRALNLEGVGWHLVPVPPPADASEEQRANPWTRISYVVQTELRGWLPQFVINSAMSSTYSAFFGGVLEDLRRLKDEESKRTIRA